MSRPELTNAARPATFEVEAYNEAGEMVPTSIAGEHPLTLYLDKREIVTLMTLGHAPEALIIGYLRNQRLVDSIDDIASVQVDWDTESAAVVTRGRKQGIEEQIRKKTVTSGCGQGTMFGDLMEEVEKINLRNDVSLADANLFALIEKVRKHETIYKQAGAVHGCALASTEGEILMFVVGVIIVSQVKVGSFDLSLAAAVLPFFLQFFNFFVGTLQAFVFTLLTIVYLSAAVAEEGH